jgi:thiol:disulfide interchange protein/DsbC/DsbD-like thiol-disulfide interchange protein
MASLHRLLPLALLAWLVATRALPAQMFNGRELVHADLIADTAVIVPGRPFTAGLLLKMTPGWHTYWQYPGDAGIPTEIKWQLPPGWKAGEIQWPVPLKLTEPGDVLIYGYHDEVLLMSEITPSAEIAQVPVKLAATASWLVCEKICVPGSASLQIELPVGTQTRPSHAELFQKYRERLPRKWPAEKGSVAWSKRDGGLGLKVSAADPASIDFYPIATGTTVVGHPRRESAGSGSVSFFVPVESQQNLTSLEGLLVAKGPPRQAWSVEKSEIVPRASTQIQRAATSPASGLAKYLLFGFLGGLILNLMPCVLPVISLKIFSFIQHAGKSRAHIFGTGAAFAAGVFAWFIGLAFLMIGLKAAGHQITWAFQFTNPYFVLGMSAVVLVFALNLFGVFEIGLPASANASLLGWSAREGYTGSFFQGVFATMLATPCTAPFLGSALGFAFTQPSIVIFVMFLAIAAGMSAPYLLLTAQPAWLRLLPKPGGWMLHVKQFMGFLLLATLLFLMWVLAVQRGPDAVIWGGAFLLALAVACWILGTFATPTAVAGARVFARIAIVLLVLASGAYFIGQKFRAIRFSLASESQGDWVAFTPERLDTELAAGHAVFVDFTAAWCLTCKFNEATVLESAPVRAAFAQSGITKIKADWTSANPAITKLLTQFGRPGVPLYVLYPAGKSDQPIVLPELLTQTILLNNLRNAAPKIALNKP